MGKPKHSNDPRGEQKGAQQHAEGQHGPKAFEAKKLEVAYGGADKPEGPRKANDPRAKDGSDHDLHERKIGDPAGQRDGGHRLWENRVQHDEADRAAEKNRRIIDVDRHGHDPEQFQIPGGNESHPAVPRDAHANIKSTGDAGGNRSDEDRG
jgi:hypothetical protein